MPEINLQVVKDHSLGKEVYRGSVRAKDLVPACWIDFHDLKNNKLGYQRPFDEQHSQQAADYANGNPEGFWPECILAIRSNDDGQEDEDEKVTWAFDEIPGTNGRFGNLTVTYNTNTHIINRKHVPWRRAFSQVDCQHRLGKMGASDKVVTFCIFPDLKREQEAFVFKTINEKQKKINTSLVDAIIYQHDPNSSPYIKWAFDLGVDIDSPFYNRVNTGGREEDSQERLVTLRTRQVCARLTIPSYSLDGAGKEIGYQFLVNYWSVIKGLWSEEFKDNKNYKLMTVPGIKGLSRFGRDVFESILDVQDPSKRRIKKFFDAGAGKINWSSRGKFKDVTGNAGAKTIHEALQKAYPIP